MNFDLKIAMCDLVVMIRTRPIHHAEEALAVEITAKNAFQPAYSGRFVLHVIAPNVEVVGSGTRSGGGYPTDLLFGPISSLGSLPLPSL